MFVTPTTTQSGTDHAPLTIAEYIEHHDPELAEMLLESELERRLSELERRLGQWWRWLDATEANFGMAPQFRADGARVFSPFLLGWLFEVGESGEWMRSAWDYPPGSTYQPSAQPSYPIARE